MNLIRKVLLIVWIVLILFLLTPIQPTLAQGYFSDNFSGSSINPAWTITNSPGLSVIQNGVLNGQVLSLSNNWESINLNKTIDASVKNVSIDYSFNFKDGGMGRIYLIGSDLSNTKYIWFVGVSDGTSALNAKPVIDIFNPDGKGTSVNSSASWNFGGPISSLNSGGSGHIEVQFLSANRIGVNFTFPKTTNGYTSKNGIFYVTGQTKDIGISFDYPPVGFYQSGECYKIDNYVENGTSQFTPMSSYCAITTNTNLLQSNQGIISNLSPSNHLFLSDSSFFAIIGLSGIGIIGVLSIFYLYQKNVNLKKLNQSQIKNIENINPIKVNTFLCANCHSRIEPHDKYCQNCGTPISTVK